MNSSLQRKVGNFYWIFFYNYHFIVFPVRFILCLLLILKIPLERIKSCNNLNKSRYLPVERIEKVLDKTHLALSWVSHKVGWGTLFPPCIILLILSSYHRHRHHYCHNHCHIVIIIKRLRDAPLSKKCSFFEHCSKGL